MKNYKDNETYEILRRLEVTIDILKDNKSFDLAKAQTFVDDIVLLYNEEKFDEAISKAYDGLDYCKHLVT